MTGAAGHTLITWPSALYAVISFIDFNFLDFAALPALWERPASGAGPEHESDQV
jgi:hypothetical protein